MYGYVRESESATIRQAAGMGIPNSRCSSGYYRDGCYLENQRAAFAVEARMYGRGRSVLGAVGGRGMNLRLRRLLSSSRRRAILAVVAVRRVRGACRLVRPLPAQQEEAMIAMKKLFGYLLDEGASVLLSGRGMCCKYELRIASCMNAVNGLCSWIRDLLYLQMESSPRLISATGSRESEAASPSRIPSRGGLPVPTSGRPQIASSPISKHNSQFVRGPLHHLLLTGARAASSKSTVSFHGARLPIPRPAALTVHCN